MSGVRLPALIIRPVWTALIFGVTSKGSTVHKSIECRGPACRTSYRGSVAVFVSNGAYSTEEEDHAVIWSKCSAKEATAVRAACQEAYARKGRLYGLLNLTDCTADNDLGHSAKADRIRGKLRTQAGALHADDDAWNPATWLHVEPIGLIGSHDAPTFKASCVGCNRDNPHNAAACHVNWQTVEIADRFVTEAIGTKTTITKIKKESESWHK